MVIPHVWLTFQKAAERVGLANWQRTRCGTRTAVGLMQRERRLQYSKS